MVNNQDERAMYLYTLQKESFKVAIANTGKRVNGCSVDDETLPVWEITRAQKYESPCSISSCERSSSIKQKIVCEHGFSPMV
jgi:hypothetical protein